MNQVVRFRAIVGVLTLGLIAGGVSALAADAVCKPTWTDPAGDSGAGDPATHPVTGDDNLDIVAVTFTVDGGDFRVLNKVVKLNPTGPDASFADRFISGFTVGKKAVTVTAERDFSGFGSKKASATVGGTAVTFPVKLIEDIKGSTIGASMAVADLEKAVGVPLAGEAFSAMTSRATSVYPGNAASASLQPTFDSAPAPAAATYTFGDSSCTGGAPAPAAGSGASPAPSASPSSSARPTASASPSPTGSAAAAGAVLPLPGCGLGTDPKGDAKALNANNPSSDPDLDITGLTFATSGSNLLAFAKVDKLAAGPAASTDGHRYTFSFTFNKKVFALAGSAYKTAASATIKDTLAATGQFSKVTQLSVDGPPLTDPNGRTNPGFVASGLKFTFDQKSSYVIASLPIADIEKYGKAAYAGAELSKITVTSATDTTVVSSQADILPDGAPTTKPSTLTYTGGDASCLPAVASAAKPATATAGLAVTAPRRVQTSDLQDVKVRFTKADGTPVSGATVTGRLGSGETVSAKTSTRGTALLRVPVTVTAGTYQLVVRSGQTTVRRTTTVLAERSLLAYTISGTGDTRLVRITLTDDDRPTKHPYANAPVTFAYGGTSMTTRTDRDGQAFVRVKTGTKLDMTYAGRPGLVTSAKRQTTVT